MRLELDNESLLLIKLFLETDRTIAIDEIIYELDIKRRKFYYILKKTNDELELNGLTGIENRRGKGFYVSSHERTLLKNLIMESDHSDYSFSIEQRRNFIICLLLFPESRLQVSYFEELFDVSRNTVFNDLRVIKDILKNHGLELKVDIKTGYFVKAELFQKLTLTQYYLYELLTEVPIHYLSFLNIENTLLYKDRLEAINKDLNGIYSSLEIQVLASFFSVVQENDVNFNLSIEQVIDFSGLKERDLVLKYFPELDTQMQLYITIQLCGNRTPFSIEESHESDIDVLDIAITLVNSFEKYSCTRTHNKMALIISIFTHLKLHMILMTYSIQLINPLIRDISNNYPDIYLFTKMAFEDIKYSVNFPIFDSVIAALTLHFGSHLIREVNSKEEALRVTIICPSGVSTSRLIGAEVKEILGNRVTINESSLIDLKTIEPKTDFFISTVDFSTIKPLIRVNPILSMVDKNRIRSLIRDSTNRPSSGSVDTLLGIIESNIDSDTYQKILKEFSESKHFISNGPSNSSGQGKSIRSVLEESKVIINHNKMHWKEAIRLGSEPLLNNDSINEEYVNSMIELVITYGPYIMMGDTIALAHSQPIKGVTSLDLSLVISNEGIYFEDNSVTHMLFILSSPDNQSHLSILNEVSNLIRSDGLDKIVNSISAEEALSELFLLISST